MRIFTCTSLWSLEHVATHMTLYIRFPAVVVFVNTNYCIFLLNAFLFVVMLHADIHVYAREGLG